VYYKCQSRCFMSRNDMMGNGLEELVLDYSPLNELQSHAFLRAIFTLWRKSAASVGYHRQSRSPTSRNDV